MFKTLSDFPVSKLKRTSREAMKLTACIWFLSCLFLKPISSVKSPCDFSTCTPLHSKRRPVFSEEIAQTLARCYVGCLEFKQVNVSSSIAQMSSDVLSWPSAYSDITKVPKLHGCTIGCIGGATCTEICGQHNLDGCLLGCNVYDQLQNDTGNGPLPNHPISAPMAAKFSSGKRFPVIYLNLNDTQPSAPTDPVKTFAEVYPGYFNSFVFRMSLNNLSHYTYMLSTSPQDNVPTKTEFHCKSVNISFAVANRYGISEYSPSGEICGGGLQYGAQLKTYVVVKGLNGVEVLTWGNCTNQGVVYPTAVTGLTYKLKDDEERRRYKVVKIELNWEPPPEYEYVTHYDIHVSTPTSLQNSDCPDYTSPVQFVAPKDATSILLESRINATGYFEFKIPAQCKFEVEIISQPEKPDDAWWNDRASLPERIETNFIGDENLRMGVKHDWNWNEAGYYTLHLSVTLPNETYIPECIDHILIQVHTASIESIPGAIKIKQVLPSEKILIKTQELRYEHFMRSRYPPFASIDELEYVFTILAKHIDSCYYYRIPKADNSELKFRAPSYAPSPALNVTVDDFYLEGSQITVTISWEAPLVTNGELWRYVIYIWHHPDPDDQQIHYVDSEFTSFQLTKEIFADKFQYIMVRAENYYKSANWSEPYVLRLNSHVTDPPVPSGLIYGVVAAAVVAAVILVVLIILTIICCWQKRKDKVVFLKDTENEWYVGGKGNAIDTVPVDSLPVDQWEISPDQIIMDKQLGSGNFGEVFLGKLIGAITTPGVGTYIGTRSVAVKLLKNDAGPELKVDFLKEISTMKKISLGRCPHVVNMVGCCTLQEPLALVLEYASYGDLLEYLRTMRRNYIKKSKEYEDMKANPYLSPLVNNITTLAVSNDYVEEFQTVKSMQEVSCEEEKKDDNPYASLGELEPFDLISFAYQIAMGMEYLASIPIVHRDLACRNILVDENKVLKISDFGLARTDELYVKNTDGKLPLRWMALESIVERTFSHKSDVWSYGVTLWEVCTLGGHPYPTISNKQLLQFLLQGNRLEKPHNCSDDIYNVMKRCWNADSEERPTFAELRATFDIMMSNQQTESYVDLNVDDLLPYYQMKPAEEDVDCPHTPTFPVVGPTKSLQSDHSDTVLPDNTSIDEPTF